MDPLGTEFWSVKNVRALLHGDIPDSLFAQVNATTMGRCDAADGVRDGLIQNPARRAFDPDSLVPSVLTRTQADAIRTIIAPVSSLLAPYGPAEIPVNENATPAPNPVDAQPWGAPPPTIGIGSPLNWYEAYNVTALLGLYQPGTNLNSDDSEKNGVIPAETRRGLYANLKLNIADDPARVAVRRDRSAICEMDRRAIKALGSALAGSGRLHLLHHGTERPVRAGRLEAEPGAADA